ncbi:hypothetical protein [Brunnivagina elsteri]|nr:hypothetical protein [Calothrix elsteri]
MALGNKPHSGNPAQAVPTSSPAKVPTNNSPNFMETLVTWAFKVLTFPLWIVTTIISQLLTPGAAGATFLGKLLFIFLVVLSSDSYWQVLFQNKPLFPWYETTWTGYRYETLWMGWDWLPSLSLFPPRISLGLFANITFYLCLGISFVIQMFESAFVTGSKFGKLNPKMIGLIAIAFWGFDIIMTFASRNPWRYEDPQQILMCILFNVFTIACAELGRWGEKVLAGKQ